MKIICVARNYAAHIEDLGNERPEAPVLFMKPDSALIPKRQPFFLPSFSREVHHELEVVLRISRVGKCIQPQFASRYYDSIGLGLDFTARDLQEALKAKGLPWEKAKAFDFSALLSPLRDKRAYDLNALKFHLDKNGVQLQKGDTRDMLWKIDDLIAYISTFFTLKIGDLIFTGTPQGVGPVVAGDLLEGYLEGEKCFELNVK